MLQIGDDGVLRLDGKAHNPKRLHVDVTTRLCQDLTPRSRCGAASFMHAGRLYVFGGGGGALGKNVTDELCSFGVRTGAKESGWTRVRCRCAHGRGPSARSECSAVVVPGSEKAYIFGGQSGPDSIRNALSSQRRDTFDDTWSLDLKTWTWFRLTTHPGRGADGCFPPARRGHSAVATPEGLMVIFGGTGLERSFACESYFNCTWGLDIGSGAWCQASEKPSRPSPRAYHTATLLDDGDSISGADTTNLGTKKYRMVVIGGTGANFHPTASGPQIQMASVGASVYAPDKLYVLTISVSVNMSDATSRTTSNIGVRNTGKTTELFAEFSWSSPTNVHGNSCGPRYGHTAVCVKRGTMNNVLVFGGREEVNRYQHPTVHCLSIPAIAVPQRGDSKGRSRRFDDTPWCWSTAVMSGGVVLRGPRFMHAAQSVSNKKMVVYGGCNLDSSDPGFSRGDVYVFNISYKHESSWSSKATKASADTRPGGNSSMLSSIESISSAEWGQNTYLRGLDDPPPSTRRLVQLERNASSTHRVIRGLRKLHANPSRQVQPLKRRKPSSTQRDYGVSGLPINQQGIEAALRRRTEIMASTRSIIQLRREEAQRQNIANIVSFEKPRNLSTIGFNNRRLTIGLGRIRSPFCLKIGMYGNAPVEVTKAGLRQRPVSAPRKRRHSRFTRSNVFTQSTQRLAKEQSKRPQSAMPAMRSSIGGGGTTLLNKRVGQTTRQVGAIVRPQSAALRRTTTKLSPGAEWEKNGERKTKKKTRPQSAHASRRTRQRQPS